MTTRDGREALRAVCSPAQWRIVELCLAGRTRAEIAKELGVTIATVRSQVVRLRGKRLPLAGRNIVSLM